MPTAVSSWISFCKQTLEVLYPTKCPLCGLLSDASPCSACFGEFVPSDPQVSRFEDGRDLAYRIAIYRYQGRAGQAVRVLKYRRSTSLAPAMASEIGAFVESLGWEYDVAVPVPIHWTRRCSRGFNQSELLARHLRADAGLLRRTRKTRPQAGLKGKERERNLLGAFEASPKVAGLRILLVDDVLTSGHTAQECARALKSAGAAEIGIIAYCGDITD